MASVPIQPAVPETVYVIIAVPALIAFTKPEEALTVAKALFELDQDPPEIVELTVVEVPEHKVASPADNVPVTGACVTSILIVAVAFVAEHAPVPETV